MGLMSRAEFARRQGVNKSTVTRWGQDGRLVERDGLVDAEASAARIERTRGTRHDVADRWAEERGVALPAQPAAATEQPPADPGHEDGGEAEALGTDEIGLRTRRAKMLSAEADARMRERQDLLAAGEVVERAAVRADLAAAAGLILAGADAMPDELTPLLTGVSDAARVRAILHDWMDGYLRTAADALARAAEGRGR